MTVWWGPVLAGAITCGLMPLVLAYSRRAGLIDEPDSRRLHSSPVPRGGGAAVVVGWLLTACILGSSLVAAGWPELTLVAALAGLGWWDDHQSPPNWLKALLQLALLAGYFGQPATVGPDWLLIPIVIGAMWWVNLYNFMDGCNGFATLQGLLTALMLAAVGWHLNQPGVALAASLLAATLAVFMPFNFPVARIFLGDVGSYGVAAIALIIAVPLLASGWPGALAVLLTVAVFVTDASLTLLRRMLAGERWYNPHRQHLYQKLVTSGWSPVQLAVGLLAVNALFILPLAGWAIIWPQQAPWAAVTGYGTLIGVWFWLYERTTKKLEH